MIYRGPGFQVIWLLPHTPTSEMQGRLRKRENLLAGDGGEKGGGRGAKVYHSEKAWCSINSSVLSVHGKIFRAEGGWKNPRLEADIGI
jgi:hypothetical protein